MPNATVRANARSMSKAAPHLNAETFALAEQFEAAWQAERDLRRGSATEAEAEIASAAVLRVAKRIAARPSVDLSMMRLKARAYLLLEAGGDLEDFSPARDQVTDPLLVSLFRDLGAERPIGPTGGSAIAANATAKVPTIRAVLPEAGGETREILMLAADFQELQAKTSLIRTALKPLEVAFEAIRKANGDKKAEEWGYQSQYWELNDELSDLCIRETNLVDSMIKLQPKTPAGIAAVAAAFKADQDHFWKKPERDRDWEISLLTRFLDGLIDLGQEPCVADRELAQGEDSRS